MTNTIQTTPQNIPALYSSVLNYFEELDTISINGNTHESQERFNDLQSIIDNHISRMMYQLSNMRFCVLQMPSPADNNPVLKYEDDQEQSSINEMI